MTLTAGTRLGSYEIVNAIGAGGMGEVYRAHDSKLNRDVAIKVLPELFAADPERLARFTREAQVLASLNHPNIAHIHGLEESGRVRALVMELVDGEDLSTHIARGPVPIADALPIAKQIADALEAAHDQGIIHRDLKPANIKLRADGTVKVLDFGLAKAMDPPSPEATAGKPGYAMNSPTLTARATQMGMIIGTAAYMAPEQARGKAVDRRADIWSFGVVLTELLTGDRAFKGDDVSEVLAKVIEREPDLSKLPANTPASLRRLIARCVVKDPKQRLRDMGEARIALAEAERELAHPASPTGTASTPVSAAAAPAWRRAVPWALVAGLLIALAAVAIQSRNASPPATPLTRTQIAFPPGVELYTAVGSSVTLSPDGATLAFVGVAAGVRQVFIRRLDQFELTPLRGTETATSCVFSPDGRELLVGLSDTSLRRLRLADGLVEMVVPTTSEFLGGWVSDGRVLFTKDGRLWMLGRTPAAPPIQLTKPEAGQATVDSRPIPVPGTDLVLFTVARPDAPDLGRIDAISVDTLTRTTVVERAASPTLTSTGHLLFLRDGVLLAAPFDANARTLSGVPTPVLRDMSVVRNRGVAAILTVSANGTLAYASTASMQSEIALVSRQGEERMVLSVPKSVANPRVTPDGRWLLFEEFGAGLWLQDLTRHTLTRLTDGSTLAAFPIFARDQREVIFRSPAGMFRQPLDGSAKAAQIPGSQPSEYPSGLSSDGTMLFYTRITSTTAGDVYVLPTAGGTPKVLVSTPAYEGGAMLSPDGKWLVYASNELGVSEIFIQPYPSLGQRSQVSAGGGVQPAWNPKGGEIVYRNGDKMVSVRVTSSAAGPVLAPPVTLFSGRYAYGGGLTIPNFGVAGDGDHFVVVKEQSGANLNVVFNWFEELKRVK